MADAKIPSQVYSPWAKRLQLSLVMAILIGLHVLAGLYHHLVRRDDTLRRMV